MRVLACALALGGAALPAPALAAPPSEAALKEAEERYNNGKALYAEGDLKGALAEFKRAYELAPAPLTLFNIGQVQFQLKDYVAALKTLQKYQADPGADPKKKEKIADDVKTLKGRISDVEIKTEEGADVVVNGEAVGKAPLPAAVQVNMGEVKIVVRKGSREKSQTLELAGGVSKQISVELPAEGAPPPPPPPPPGEKPSAGGPSAAVIGTWVTTGVLAITSGILGGLALGASDELKNLKKTAGVTREELDGASGKVTGLAAGCDVSTVAAVIMLGVSIGVTVADGSKKGEAPKPSTSLRIGPGGFSVVGSF